MESDRTKTKGKMAVNGLRGETGVDYKMVIKRK
jgi:hypothetical protein